MASDPNIKTFKNVDWKNYHGNVEDRISRHILVQNENPGTSSMKGMRATAARLQSIIKDARDAGARMRVLGSRWSFSDIMIPGGEWILETDQLGYWFDVATTDLEPHSTLSADELHFVQGGRKISEINNVLEKRNRRRSLRTSGASNGQTIAGAIGTGTHGSAIGIGGMESQVVGIQLLSADRNLWLEPAKKSEHVMNARFAEKLGAELIRDDLLFHAALVSLGALGIVHAVMLKTTGRFKLNSSLVHVPYEKVRRAMTTLDFTDCGCPDTSRPPYFFQVVTDPAQPQKTYATFRYKELCAPDYEPKYDRATGYATGTDMPALIGRALELIPVMRNLAVGFVAKSEMGETHQAPEEYQTHGETYNFTTAKSGVAGAAFGVPVAQATKALELAQAAFREVPEAPIIHACRYVCKSTALLGWTRYDPTCVIDIDGVEGSSTDEVIARTADHFEAAGMPFTMHWGKINKLDSERVRRAYGGGIDHWENARKQLLPDASERKVFSSPTTDRYGLT